MALAGELEEDAGDLFGDLVGFLAAHCLRHGGVFRDAGAYAYDEGLSAHAAYNFFRIFIRVGLNGAEDCFIANGAEWRTFWRALREVGGELFGDVGHVVDGDAQVADGGGLLAGVVAGAGALIVHGDGQRHGSAEDAAGGGFVEPGAFC